MDEEEREPNFSEQLVKDNEIQVEIEVEEITAETGPRKRSIVRRGKTKEIWTQGEIIGRGSFGSVSLYAHQKGVRKPKLQAVKRVMKGRLSMKELDAILKFSLGKYEGFFVKCHGWYSNHDCLFIVMEYLEHGDLHAYLEQVKKPLPESEARIIVSQVAEGLDYLHESKFVHRDIKPANILIVTKGPEWEVKIGDFGGSKSYRNDSSLFSRVGTRYFCAPEVLGYHPKNTSKEMKWNYTPKVDIWSLGATAFYLLFQTYPFAEDLYLLEYVLGIVPLQFPSTLRLTDHCNTFLRESMAPQATERPSAVGVLQSEWLTENLLDSKFESLTIDKPDQSPAQQTQPENPHAATETTPKDRVLTSAIDFSQQTSNKEMPDPEQDASNHTGMLLEYDTSSTGPVSDVRAPTTLPEESYIPTFDPQWYSDSLFDCSITLDQIMYLHNHWLTSTANIEIFIQVQGHNALSHALEKFDKRNPSSVFAQIAVRIQDHYDMRPTRGIIMCLKALSKTKAGYRAATENPRVFRTLVHSLFSIDLETRRHGCETLIVLINQGAPHHAYLQILGIFRAQDDFYYYPQIRIYSWIRSITLTLDECRSQSVSGLEWKTLTEYLTWTFSLVNTLVDMSSSKDNRNSLRKSLAEAGMDYVLVFLRLREGFRDNKELRERIDHWEEHASRDGWQSR